MKAIAMKRSILAVALAATCLLAVSAQAGDAWEDQAKQEIAYFKKYAKKAKDASKWADLAMGVVGTQHPLAAKELGKILMRDKDLEHQMILAAAMADFVDKEEGRVVAGEWLHKALDKGKYETEVIDSIVNSIGKLKYKPAVFSLCDMMKKGGDPYLMFTVVRAAGNLEDLRALPTLLGLWEKHPVGYSWETGDVSVDTGASGTADQEAAEAAWKAKYGNSMKAKGKPSVMFKLYIQELAKSVAKITGEKLGSAQALREWMEAHIDELKEAGVEIPRYKGAPRKKDKDAKKKGKKKK